MFSVHFIFYKAVTKENGMIFSRVVFLVACPWQKGVIITSKIKFCLEGSGIFRDVRLWFTAADRGGGDVIR